MSTILSWVDRVKLFWFFSVGFCVGKNQMCHLRVGCLFTLTHNGLQLPEGGDFEALHCQPSTKLDLTTEPPLLGRCCYATYFSFFKSKWINFSYFFLFIFIQFIVGLIKLLFR